MVHEVSTPWDREYTVHRTAQGSVVDGDFVPGSPSEFPVVGVLDPLTPKQIEQLPEGSRTKAKWQLTLDADQPELRSVDIVGDTAADRVAYKGRLLVVHAIWDASDPPLGSPGGELAHRHYHLTEEGADE